MNDLNKDSVKDWGAINPGKLLEAIHKVSSDVIYLFDLESQSNVYISKGIGEALGYSPEEIKRMGSNLLSTILHPDDLARVPEDQKILEQLKDGEIYYSKSRFKKADGGLLYLKSRQMVYSRDDKGNAKIILGVTHDITELEEKQIRLQEMAVIAQKTTNAIMITNRDEEIEWVNDGYEKLTGYTLAEVIGKKPNILVKPSERNIKAIEQMRSSFAKGESFSSELVSFTKTGEEFWVRVIADPLFNDKGEVLSYIFVAQNVTELKSNEGRLLQSYERLKKYAFFTSHQLRSPVADILSILDVYDYNNPSNPDNIKLLNDLKTVSLKLDNTVHELNELLSVDTAKFSDDQKAPQNLQNIMLVDDDKVFINITSIILKRFNEALAIESYTNPMQALEELKKDSNYPDAIFLDINMPDIDGWKFLENMEEMGISTNVYMLTSSIDPSDMEKSKTFSSVKGYFTKPLTKKVLTDHFFN
jgi:PAS domain S-box-containing protein